MSEVYFKQSGFTYSVCRTFTKNKERIQKFKEKRRYTIFYENDLEKACFQHIKAYGYFKYLARTTASDKVLRDE